MTVEPTLQVTVGAGLPVAVTMKGTEAAHCPVSLLTGMGPGQAIIGGVLAIQVLPRTVTVWPPALAFVTRRSGLPSKLKSAAAMAAGKVPEAKGEPAAGVKPPLPLPKRMVTLAVLIFVTARSGLPSTLKSPAAMSRGSAPGVSGDPAG